MQSRITSKEVIFNWTIIIPSIVGRMLPRCCCLQFFVQMVSQPEEKNAVYLEGLLCMYTSTVTVRDFPVAVIPSQNETVPSVSRPLATGWLALLLKTQLSSHLNSSFIHYQYRLIVDRSVLQSANNFFKLIFVYFRFLIRNLRIQCATNTTSSDRAISGPQN